jgi:protein involved in polysaccharide export with SLBB domain
MIGYFGKNIKVKGETTDEIRHRVYNHLIQQGLLKNPIIMLTVTSTQDVFVGGAVRAPGRYPLNSQQEIGLQRAIALAGGIIGYFGKNIKVKGETTDEIRHRVYNHLIQQGLLKNPIIMLTVTSTQDVFVGGAVRAPGRYPLNSQQEIGLQRAIALAGGIIGYFGKNIKVKGETTDEIRHRVYNHLIQQGLLKNPIIMLTVTSTQDVFVGGAVRAPGRYPLNSQQEIGLQRAIALAGGILETGDFYKVQVIRQNQKIETLDLSPGTDYHHVAIQSGDLVFVPTLAQVEVQGQVQIPGKILIRQRIRIDHALTRAGGPIYDEADLSKLVIGKPDGNQVIIEVSEQFMT